MKTLAALDLGAFILTGPVYAESSLLKPVGLFDGFLGQVTHVSVRFHNNTDERLLVVMDNDRERYIVAPGGNATFRNARIGDNPTLHIRDPKTGEEFDSWEVGILTGDADLDYN